MSLEGLRYASMLRQEPWRFAMTVGLGALGGCLFFYFSIPVGMMLGALCFVATATLAGMPTVFPDRFRRGLLIILGVIFGERVTPETLQGLWLWPGSLTVLVITSMMGVFVAVIWVRRIGWGRDTAWLAALPGALSSVMGMGMERKAMVEYVLMSQLTRLLGLIFITPLIVILSGHSDTASALMGFNVTDFRLGWQEVYFLLHCLAGFLLVKLCYRFRLRGMEILSGFSLAALTHGTGWVETQSSSWVFSILALLLGSMIGTRISNIGLEAFRKGLKGTIVIIFVITGFTLIAVMISAFLFGLDPVLLFVAYAPGGLEAMLVLGLSLGVNPTFVLVHHLLRYMLIVLAIPLIFRQKPI